MTISLEDAAREAHLTPGVLKDWAEKHAFLSQKRGDGSLLLDRADFQRWLRQLPPRRCDLDPDKRWYSLKEIVKLTGVPLPILQRDVDNGILQTQQTREQPVVEEAHLNRWLREGRHAEPEPEYWTLPRAAKFVGLAYEVLLAAARDGKLLTREEPHFFLGKRQMVNPDELLKWLEGIPYRKEAAQLPGVVEVAEAARLAEMSAEKARGLLGESAWNDRMPRRSLDQWLKKLGLPPSWREREIPAAPAPREVPVAPIKKAAARKVTGAPVIEWPLGKIVQRWGVPRHALESGIRTGELRARQVSRGNWVVDQAELERWMDERSRI